MPATYPGDGRVRQPGDVWVDETDVQPGTAPAWVASSEIDGANGGASAAANAAPRRAQYVTPPAVSAAQVAVVDETSGLLLYGKEPHSPEPPASTTKIATALVAMARTQGLDQVVPITVDGWKLSQTDGSSVMGLQPGQKLKLGTLLYGLMLPSGNDAAEQLAVSLGGTRAQFVAWMNEQAAVLGLRNTHFENPSGIDQDGHVASAYDLAQLARAAMRSSTFRTIVSSTAYRAEGFLLEGHNPLLGAYPGADGVKTGSTDLAGRTMVASATRDGHRVYVVVMHSDDLQADTTALLDWAWASFSWGALPSATPSPAAPRATASATAGR